MIWLADLLVVAIVIQVVLFRGGELATAGLIQYCMSGVFAGWAVLAFVTRRKQPDDAEGWVTRLMRIPRMAETLLITAYICAATSWLNLLAEHAELRVSTVISVLTVAMCSVLFFVLTRYQDLATGVLRNQKGMKRVRAVVAWVILTGGYGLPLVGGGAVITLRKAGEVAAPELTSPELALAWVCLCSFFFALVLFRPFAMKISPKIAFSISSVLAGILAGSARLEQIWRRDWYLYTLTSVTFVGIVLGTWRLIDSLYMTHLQKAEAISSPAGPPMIPLGT